MWIYIAHRRGTSNALYALVRCKQKRLSLFPETVSACNEVNRRSKYNRTKTELEMGRYGIPAFPSSARDRTATCF